MPFGCEILVHDILDKTLTCNDLGARQLPYEDLLTKADILSFHVPGGAATRGMFGVSELTKTKKNLLVINTARGGIIDFEAITKAVLDHRIAGYASDVFPEEPLISRDFKVESGFYFTPHIGGNADEAVVAMGRAAIKGLNDFWRQS